MPAFVDTMAFAGQVPWHGLGTKLAEDATTDIIIPAAGLDWKIKKIPAEYRNPVTGEVDEIDGRYWLARDDSGILVSRETVSSVYQEVQNRQLFEFGDALTITGEARWHTAGSLHDGGRIWALAQVKGQFDVGNDMYLPYILLYDARDKSSQFRARFVLIRVVCANTAAAALAGDAVEVSIPHRGNLEERLELAAETLGLAETSFSKQREIVEQLGSESFSEAAMRMFVIQMATGKDDRDEAMDVFRGTVAKGGRALTNLNTFGDEVMRLYNEGKGNEGATKKDAFNSITEFIDQQRGRMSNYKRLVSKLTPEGLDSAWFGEGDRKKKRALKLLVGGGTA
jgi:phage/plasmid-like protein (TIGR03299 family)